MRPGSGQFERVPLESREPLLAFSVIRALIAGATVIGLAILGFPYGGRVTALVAGLVLPWALLVIALTRRRTEAGLSLLVVVGDFIVLGALIAAQPELYAPVHFAALFLVAAHAHFQGAQRSLLVGLLPPLILIPVTVASDPIADDGLLHAYETVFAVTCVAAALVVGSLRTAESSGRLRARALSRRAIDTESEVRRRLAEAIHDGPVQELASVEMMLASAERALERGDDSALEALREARQLTRSNISFLRDEIVDLGPYAFEERSLEQAVADCREVWERRYGVRVAIDLGSARLDPEVAGALFRITQEAVTNAGRHAQASTVTVRLRAGRRSLSLEVEDDGRGFGDIDPLGPAEPGHIGLASMRERAEMLGGQLTVESGKSGTLVCAAIPL